MDVVDRFAERFNRLPTERDPQYLEMLNMSKYRILTRPDVGPHAKCANCGSSREDERMYLDFGVQVDWYGPIYFCSLCLNEFAVHMGLFKAMEVQILQLELKIEELKGQRISAEELRNTVLYTYEEVKKYFDNVSVNGIDSSSDKSASVESSKQGSQGTESGTKTVNLRTSESAAKSGSKNISSLADLLDS